MCFLHLFGDFGTRGLPGTFYVLFVRVVIQMARSELVLVIPLVVYVGTMVACLVAALVARSQSVSRAGCSEPCAPTDFGKYVSLLHLF